MRIQPCMAAGACLILGACAAPYRFVDAPKVPEWQVINGLKCELSAFLTWVGKQKHSGRRFFVLDKGQVADVELTLKTTRDKGAGVSAVLAFAGGSVVPALGVSVSESEVITGTTNFLMQQRFETQTVDCAGLPGDRPGVGLAEWLQSKFATEAEIRTGSPRVGLRSLVVQTDFGIKVDGSAKVTFVPVNITPSAFFVSEDVQSLKITFRGMHSNPKAAEPGIKKFAPKIPNNPDPTLKTTRYRA